MPLYDYACTKCGRVYEVRHGFDESHSEPCASCGSPLRRVFNPAPILFKGSGFYVTDSRKGSAATSEPAKTDAKPAAKTEAPAEKAPAAAKLEKKSSEPAA